MEKVISIKNKIAPWFFYAGLVLLLFVDYVSATYVAVTYAGKLIQLALVCLFVKLILTRYSLKEWLVILLLLGLGVYSYLTTDQYTALEIFLFVVAAKGIQPRTAMGIYLVFVGGVTIAAFTASVTGLFGEVYQALDFRGTGVQIRYCFGYNHPNTCHIVILQLMLAGIWYFWEKIRWHHILVSGILNTVLFFFTASRTNLALGSVLLILLLFAKIKSAMIQYRGIYIVNYLLVAVSVLLSVLAVLTGTRWKVLEWMDRLWTKRVYYAYVEAADSVPSLFSGVDLQISCDMGFVKMFYNYGAVISLLLLVGLLWLIYDTSRKKDFAACICIFAGTVFLLGEKFSSGEFITRNFLMLYTIGLWRAHETDKPKEQIN